MSGPTYRRVRKITWPCKFSTSCAGDALPSGMLAHPESVVDAQDLF